LAPIGIFDSGLGGLSVLREVRSLLPSEDVLYFADSAYCPYGVRSPEEITERVLTITADLIDRGIKLLVVACNTASSVAIDDVRATFPIPIVGLEPAVKPAARLSRSGKVAVIATPLTVAGPRLADLIERHGNGTDIRLVPAPGWVDLVEAGRVAGPDVERDVRELVEPLIDDGVDTLILGCTHYPFLRPVICDIAGPAVQVIDSGEAIARRTRDVLARGALARPLNGPGDLRLFTTGDAAPVSAISSCLLAIPITATTVVL
jgi:glutamate racemase